MGENSEDLRTKVSPETLKMLDALTRANAESMQDRVRALIQQWIDAELHAHTLRCRLLRSEGVEGDELGHHNNR